MVLEEMCYSVIRDLNAYGVCVLDSFLGEQRGHNVLDEVKRVYSSGMFRVSYFSKKEDIENQSY